MNPITSCVELWVQGSAFEVQGLGFGVQGLGVWAGFGVLSFGGLGNRGWCLAAERVKVVGGGRDVADLPVGVLDLFRGYGAIRRSDSGVAGASWR